MTGTGFRFACFFPDGPASPTVQAQVQDTDGAPSNLASLAVTVNNVAPDIIIFDGPTTANEGETIPYSFEFFDQGDDIVSFAAGFPDCGAGGTLGSVLLDIFVGAFECAFPDGPASPTVRVQLTDSDGANSTIESLQVNVSNVRPSVSLISPDTDADEGDTNTYDFTVADPGDDTFTVLSGFPGCGSSGDLVNASLTTDPNGGSFQCSFLDGPGSSTVAIQVTDSDQQDSIQSTATVNVSNVAPNLTISGVPNVDEGSSYTLNLASSDPGDDTIQSWTINWNDGSAPQLVVGSPPSVTHVFPGDFDTPTITADATDEDGTFSSNTHTITVNNLDPIINSVTAVDQQLPAAGGTSTISVDATDPGPGDIPGLLFSFDCDNDPTTGIDGFEVVPQQANSAICTFDAADRGANTVNVKVEDPDGGFALADTVVIVGAAVNLVLLPSTATPEVGTTGTLTLRVITNSTPVDSVDTVFSFFGSRLSFAGVVENTSGLPNVLCSTVLLPEGNADVTIRCTASGTTPVTADFDMAVITYNADNIGPASVEFDPDPARTGAESGGVPVLERAALPAGGATVSVQGFVDVELTVSLQAVPRAGDNVRFEVALLDSGALNPSIANTPWLVFSQATPIHTFTIPVAEPAVSQTFTLVLPQVRTAVYDITVVARRYPQKVCKQSGGVPSV